jgi:hypothetical protein
MAIGTITVAAAEAEVEVAAARLGALTEAAAMAIDAISASLKGRCAAMDFLNMVFSNRCGPIKSEYYFRMLQGNNIALYFFAPSISA